MRIVVTILLVLAGASSAFAQAPPPPTPPSPFLSAPHPAMSWSWNSYSPVHWGTVVDQVWVPPQPVAIQVYVRQPEGIPEEWQTQIVEVPGYYVVRTTKGTVYPERWALDQTGPGMYQWRKLPPYFESR